MKRMLLSYQQTHDAVILARGARPHWLGHLGVDDVERAAAAFVARGAARLGPTRPAPDGGAVAGVRDPGGAVVALIDTPALLRPDIVWFSLNTNDLARASAAYRELFGWQVGEPRDLGALGVYHPFAWAPGGPSVGAIADTAGRTGVHAHWLFHFRVAALVSKRIIAKL